MDTHGAATAHRHGPNHVDMMNLSSTAKEVHAAKQIHAARSTPLNNAATTAVPATNTANLPTSNNSLVTITSLEGGDNDVVVDYELDDVAEERRSGTKRKRETKEERQSRKAEEQRKAKGRNSIWGNGAVSQGWVKGRASRSGDRISCKSFLLKRLIN